DAPSPQALTLGAVPSRLAPSALASLGPAPRHHLPCVPYYADPRVAKPCSGFVRSALTRELAEREQLLHAALAEYAVVLVRRYHQPVDLPELVVALRRRQLLGKPLAIVVGARPPPQLVARRGKPVRPPDITGDLQRVRRVDPAAVGEPHERDPRRPVAAAVR